MKPFPSRDNAQVELPPDRVEVLRSNVTVIDGEPVRKENWCFRRFETLGGGCEWEGNVAEVYTLADAVLECQRYLDQGVPVFPAGGADA